MSEKNHETLLDDPDQPSTELVEWYGLSCWFAYDAYRSLGECAADNEFSTGDTKEEAIAAWRVAQAAREARS